MPATPIANPASGESLVATEPQLLQQVDPGWRRRLNLFTGRALSDTALHAEQAYRAGSMSTLGQSVSPGTVAGLALTLQPDGADPLLLLTPGYGIGGRGEDARLDQTIKTRLSTLAVVDAGTGLATGLSLHQAMTAAGDPPGAGILVLQSVIAQVSGVALDTGAGPVVVSGNLASSCGQDPDESAFEDWQIADAVRLVYVPWPASALTLPLRDPAPTWRNRLAEAIFDAESQLGPDDQLPWVNIGVPVGLIGFDAGSAWTANTAYAAGQIVMDGGGNRQRVSTAGTSGAAGPATWNTVYGATTADGSVTWTNDGLGWKPLFIDCSVVVRAGGLPKRRVSLPALAPPLRVWQSNTAYAVTDFIVDPNGNIQNVTTAGTSGGPPPKWSTTSGSATADGPSLVWTCNGPSAWRANTTFNTNQFIFDSRGHRQNVIDAGTSGATEPSWNGAYLPTRDGSITWINQGTGTPPVIQPGLAQARINQLSEQLGQTLAQGTAFTTLADIFPTLPPSGLLPAAALDFANLKAPWLPRNWSVTAAPVRLEQLETVLETGMSAAMIDARATAPTDASLMEPIEVLVPLPDAVYDSNILIVETVAPVFAQEAADAVNARNLNLQEMITVQAQINVLLTAIGPNSPATPGLLDPDAGLTPQEIAGRDVYPPFLPGPDLAFSTLLQGTWAAGAAYAVDSFVIDSNGVIQVAVTAGTSGAAAPTWNTTVAQPTTDGGVTWLNNGSWSWAPGTQYVAHQFVVDPAGFRHIVTVAGRSAAQPPAWNDTAAATTLDGVLWQPGGNAIWQPDIAYAVGALVLDQNKNVQIVQTGGISGDVPPPWNINLGQTTQDSGVTWKNLGGTSWQPATSYAAGSAIIDANGIIQTAKVGGASGASAPAWNDAAEGTTTDAAVSWVTGLPLTWRPNFQYAAGALVLDSDDGLQVAKVAGVSGATAPAWAAAPGATTTDNTVTWSCNSFVSTDIAGLLAAAGRAPYVIPSYAISTGVSATSLNLLSASDLALIAPGGDGLASLLTRLNARVAAANDLIDTGFLTSQTDIYRYRQNVLGATAASALATSSVLANIAKGSTAAATASNLQSYVSALSPAPATVTTTTAGAAPTVSTTQSTAPKFPFTFQASAYLGSVASSTNATPVSPIVSVYQPPTGSAASSGASTVSGIFRLLPTPVRIIHPAFSATTTLGGARNLAASPDPVTAASSRAAGLATFVTQTVPLAAALRPQQSVVPQTPTPQTDITNQSPLPGAQTNLRTLTVAERMAQSPSQEAMFYSIANRSGFLLSLKALCEDLGLVVDDLQVLVDAPPNPLPPAPGSTTPPQATFPVLTRAYSFGEWRNATTSTPQASIQSPYLPQDASEATLFSVGVRVIEQHTMLLRALEARVQQYASFTALCANALDNLRSQLQRAKSYLGQLQNALHQERQSVAFTSALLREEQARVAQLNNQRQQVLKSAVQLVAYTRARTLEATETAPSRQLLPTNIVNPVPTCLQQSVSIPPELREIVGQLREAPLSWLPALAVLVAQLQRPTLLQRLAESVRQRAVLQLQSATPASSALTGGGGYSTRISQLYASNQQIFRGFLTQRAAIQPASLNNLSWSVQVANLQYLAAVNDLISADSVHAEISNKVTTLIQQISNVATCLYTRASIALPVDRLAWAEYLQGPGASVGLRSLATLPQWNDLTYIDRQQMQLLVDWLFGQIDGNNPSATAYVSDVARTAILLASDVPIDHIVPAGVIARTRPALGGVVSLGLASNRVASGMYVNLYSGADLAARAVVTDQDSETVSATVTDVFKPDTYLETTDTAHISSQIPQALALRSLFSRST